MSLESNNTSVKQWYGSHAPVLVAAMGGCGPASTHAQCMGKFRKLGLKGRTVTMKLVGLLVDVLLGGIPYIIISAAAYIHLGMP